MGHEKEIGTNNSRLVEFDLSVRIFNTHLKPRFFHPHLYLLHHNYYDLTVHPYCNYINYL